MVEYKQGRNLVLAVNLTKYEVIQEHNHTASMQIDTNEIQWDGTLAKTFPLSTDNALSTGTAEQFGLKIVTSPPPLNGCIDIIIARLGTRDEGLTHYCPPNYFVFLTDPITKLPKGSTGLQPNQTPQYKVAPQNAQQSLFYQQPERTVLILNSSKPASDGSVIKHHLVVDLFLADIGFNGYATGCRSISTTQLSFVPIAWRKLRSLVSLR